MSDHVKVAGSSTGIRWRVVLVEGLISILFAVALATVASFLTYTMLASLAEQNEGQIFNMTYLEAAPILAAVVYVVFFVLSMLALTRLRVMPRAASRARLHWLLAFSLYSVIGLPAGLAFWLLLSAADRPGI